MVTLRKQLIFVTILKLKVRGDVDNSKPICPKIISENGKPRSAGLCLKTRKYWKVLFCHHSTKAGLPTKLTFSSYWYLLKASSLGPLSIRVKRRKTNLALVVPTVQIIVQIFFSVVKMSDTKESSAPAVWLPIESNPEVSLLSISDHMITSF